MVREIHGTVEALWQYVLMSLLPLPSTSILNDVPIFSYQPFLEIAFFFVVKIETLYFLQ